MKEILSVKSCREKSWWQEEICEEDLSIPRFVCSLFTEGDIFGAKKKKKQKKIKQYNGAAIHSFNDLKIGDYVVHENHGLGIYQGIEKIEKDHVTKDYLKVAYAAGSNLYVPATSLEVLQNMREVMPKFQS